MARELRDYLSITPAEARRQWLALLARNPAPAGKRQVDLIPVETLMSLAASLRVTHRHCGGNTAAKAGEPVPSLARLFSRPNSSILAKMAKLDGSRRNGAKYEIEVAERLLNAPGTLEGMYMQHRFAVEVLSNHGHRCVFCGLHVETPKGRAARMLVASHIKPWRESSASERLDLENGLSACPTHDVAFDTGLLTVNGGLRIHVNSVLARQVATDAATRSAFGHPPLAERLLIPLGARAPKGRYLAWHQLNVFVEPLGVGA